MGLASITAPLSFRERWGRHLGATFHRKLAASLPRQCTAAPREDGKPMCPLLAEQIAGGMLALLQAWTAHRLQASPAETAQALWRFARAASQGATSHGHL